MKTLRSTLLCAAFAMLCSHFSPLSAQNSSKLARLDSLERRAMAENDPAEKARLLNTVSFTYLEIDADKAQLYGEQALALAEKHGLAKETARAYNSLASRALFLGDMQQALAYFEQSLARFKEAGYERGVADVLGNMGHVYYAMGSYAKALDYDLRSLRMFEQLGFKLGMANQSVSIGSIYMEQGNYEKAIHYDTTALELYRQLGDDDGVALVLGNLANIYLEQRDLAKARDYLLKAIEVYENTGNSSGVARNLSNLSTLYHDLGDYTGALRAQKRALDLFEAASNRLGICYTLGNMGTAHFLSYENYHRRDSAYQLIPGARQTLLDEAIRLLRSSVELGQELEDLSSVSRFSRVLSKAYEAKGDLAQAFKYFKVYTAAKDSLQSTESKHMIEQLTTEREVELKDKQIELDRLAVEKKRNERLYFGIGIGLLLLSMLFVYRNYDNQKKSNVRLAALNTQIAEANTELADKNVQLSQTLSDLRATQEQLVESEKQKEKALIRSRISQDIHDDISSGLTKISWLSESFMAKAAQSATDIGPLVKINDLARDTVTKLGEIIWSSNPDRDNLESLLAYMRRYIEHYMDEAPMRWRVDFPSTVPDLPLNPELRRNLYLVMKEALHNARKYSQATEITVAFALDGNSYRLEVRDDGVGMSPGTVQGGGNGMVNMRRRMEAIGGRLSAETAPGKGLRMVFEGEA